MAEIRAFVNDEAFRVLVKTSAEVGMREAKKSGRTYVLASALQPCFAIHVLPDGHPKLAKIAMTKRFLFTPSGDMITLPQ